jgi:hypothetical protein
MIGRRLPWTDTDEMRQGRERAACTSAAGEEDGEAAVPATTDDDAGFLPFLS